MGPDLMSYLRSAFSWAGSGEATSSKGTQYDGNAGVGAGPLEASTPAHSVLGGLVGGFGAPMEWKGAGFGGQAGGTVTDRDGNFFGGNAGLGLGAGYSSWSGTDKGVSRDGVSGVVGGVAPVGVTAGNSDIQGSASTNLYRGVGGSAYEYSKGSEHGYGAAGSYTQFGLADTNASVNTPYGSASAHADDAYFGRASGGATIGRDGDTYKASGNAGLYSGVDGAKGQLETPFGTTTGGVGSVRYGTGGSGDVSVDSRTGAVNANASVNDGLSAQNIQLGIHSPDGKSSYNASVGNVSYGMQGTGSANWDPSKGQFDVNASGRGGGVAVNNTDVSGNIDGVGSGRAHLGEFSNDNVVSGSFTANKDGFGAKGSWDGGGVRMSDFNADGQLGNGAVTGSAGFKSLGNTNSVQDASFGMDWSDPNNPKINSGFKSLSIGDWGGTDLHASVNGPLNSGASASVKEFSTGTSASDFKSTISKDGLDASLGHGQYNDLDIKGVDLDSHIGSGMLSASSSAHLGEGASDKFTVDGAHVDASLDGIHASAQKAQYDEVYLNDLHTKQQIGGGLAQTQVDLGEGTFNHASAENIHAGLDSNGLSAGLENGHYSFLGGDKLNVQGSVLNDAAGFGVSAGKAQLGGVNVGSLQTQMGLESSHLDANNLEAYGWKAQDQNVNAHIGALQGNVGAKSVDLADLKVGSAKMDTSNFGTSGNASVQDANLDLAKIQGGHAGIGWDGKEVVGVKTDVQAGGGVGSANANWNMAGGTADAQFKDANVGAQISNTHLNLFGNDIKVPDMGAKLNASGGANVDVSQGAANANLSLAGSGINFMGHEINAPSWAQAGGGVNLSQGAANANLGGADGVGADVNLSKGQLDVNAFGHHIDVAGGIRDAGSTLAGAASTVMDHLPSLPHIW